MTICAPVLWTLGVPPASACTLLASPPVALAANASDSAIDSRFNAILPHEWFTDNSSRRSANWRKHIRVLGDLHPTRGGAHILRAHNGPMPRPILIDCDPGHDDAIAILLALGNESVDLVGVTTVAGNGTLENTTLNARRVLALAGVDSLPLAAGAPRPLMRDRRTAADIHGESGLDGTEWGEFLAPLLPDHAVDLIVDLASTHRGEFTLLPTGPLTNIALALRREPRLTAWVREVVLMGGSYTRGNTTPAAEFNMLVDPEAAAVVFGAPWQVTMIGLDVTHRALATRDVLDRIAHSIPVWLARSSRSWSSSPEPIGSASASTRPRSTIPVPSHGSSSLICLAASRRSSQSRPRAPGPRA